MTTPDRIMLCAEGVAKTYQLGKSTIDVLKGASLAVRDGERLAVVGASGAGKSTLLHILGGLDRPDAGHILLGDEDLYGISSAQRTRRRATRIGFVFQSYHLLPEMDVWENVMLPALALGKATGRGRARERALELLKAVGLAERAGHRPMELSGGEQQRAALARALMNSPDIVLADEPTGNLDEKTGNQVLDHLFALMAKRGHALILVTHNRRTAGLCDRVLTLADGVLRDG